MDLMCYLPTDDAGRYEDDAARICGVDHPSVDTWNTWNTWDAGSTRFASGSGQTCRSSNLSHLKQLINLMDVYLNQ